MKTHKSSIRAAELNKHIFKEYGILGSEFYSNSCGKFTVISKESANKYKIKFISTGEIYTVSETNLLSGEIKDYMFPTIRGIACLGRNIKSIRKDKELHSEMLRRYHSIIKRCYDTESKSYAQYGNLGVKVCDRWLNYSNFYNDIIELPNFDREQFISGELVIDKDIKQWDIPISQRVYSKDTVTLVSRSLNNKFRDFERMGDKHSIYFICIDNLGNESLCKNVNKFARQINCKPKKIFNILNGRKNKYINNFTFRYLTDDDYEKYSELMESSTTIS